jgi:LPS-assembly lipoprotein
MLSSSRTLGAILMALALTATLTGCTGLIPVHGQRGLGSERVEVSYEEPSNRLEQIIYQDLALRLGKSSGDVPRVRVSASQHSVALTNSTVSAPSGQRQMVVTGRIRVTDAAGEVLFSGTRSQTADYTSDAQTLANQQAEVSAARQAALLLADTIRLEIIAALGR